MFYYNENDNVILAHHTPSEGERLHAVVLQDAKSRFPVFDGITTSMIEKATPCRSGGMRYTEIITRSGTVYLVFLRMDIKVLDLHDRGIG